jgi:catechol 2,3-dioxygenase-like lactoylglutathione lyase family enzyme
VIRGVDHTSFVVSDLDRSIDFYERLGADLEWRIDHDDVAPLRSQVGFPTAVASVAQLRLPGDAYRLELIQYIQPKGAQSVPMRCDVGAAHLCLVVDDIHKEVERLHASHIEVVSDPQYFDDGPDAGSWAVYFLDPDGITLELSQGPTPAEAEREPGATRAG